MAKYYKATSPRLMRDSGFRARLTFTTSTDTDVGWVTTSMSMVLRHLDPAVVFAAVKVAEWGKTSELLLQLEKVVKLVDIHRPRAKQPATAVAGLRAMRCDLFSAHLTDNQVHEAYLLLTEVYEALDRLRGEDVRLKVDDVWYENDDGVCYDVEVAG